MAYNNPATIAISPVPTVPILHKKRNMKLFTNEDVTVVIVVVAEDAPDADAAAAAAVAVFPLFKVLLPVMDMNG